MPLTEENAPLIEAAAERAATKVLEHVFAHLGYDIHNPEHLEALRERMEFLKRMERGGREAKNALVKTCVGAFVMGFIALLVMGIKTQIHEWFPPK